MAINKYVNAEQVSDEQLKSRYQGALLGLAVGDAIGTTLEFKAPGSFDPVTDMVGGGPFSLNPGEWTDDTSMALCLASSILESGGFDPDDQMQRYLRWYQEGYMSSTGHCFDIGNTVRTALADYEVSGEPYSGSTHERSAGNGSLMRLAPIPMAYRERPIMAIELAAQSSRTTHGAEECVDACRYFTGLIIGALNGEDKEVILSTKYAPVRDLWSANPLSPRINEVAEGSFKHLSPPEIKGSGYVVKAMEAALWAFYISSSFEEGALLAVNLGDDADTTGAIYGQLAGAFYGMDGIPERWLKLISDSKLINSLAEHLLIDGPFETGITPVGMSFN